MKANVGADLLRHSLNTENEGDDSGKLDEDVDGRAGGVLKRVTDGVTRDGSSLDVLEVRGVLCDRNFFSFSLNVDYKSLSLNDLLGVVPSATGVGGGEGNLNTRDNAASEDTVSSLETE